MIKVFDLGMCDGYITDIFIEMFNRLKVDYEVYGFEPYRDSFNTLLEKYKNNDNIKVFNIAFTDNNERCRLYKSPIKQANSIHQSNINVDPDQFEEVDAMAFSQWFYENIKLQPTDYTIMKINIEGSEFEVYKDIIVNNIHKHINIFCGSLGDIYKIGRSEAEINTFLNMLDDAQISCIKLTPNKINIEVIKEGICQNYQKI